MSESLESSIRRLGGEIYTERQRLVADPVIHGSPTSERIATLDLAARWNAIALSGVSQKADRR